jgi:hypothetical protein
LSSHRKEKGKDISLSTNKEMSFICAYNGQCEDDSQVAPYTVGEELPVRHHHWLSECQTACQASHEKELEYLVAEYALHTMDDIYALAPSDRREVVYRMTKVWVTEDEAFDVLVLITQPKEYDFDPEELLPTLARYPGLWKYLLTLDYAGINKLDPLLKLGRPEVLHFLSEHGYGLKHRDWATYLSSSTYDEESRDFLFEEVEGMFVYLVEYPSQAESDVPGLVALSNLKANPRAAEWYNELVARYRDYLVSEGWTEINENVWPFG